MSVHVVPARIARTGVQDYGDHVEYRPASSVFDPESMRSFEGVPVTVGHVGWVTRENWDELVVGYVRNVQRDENHLRVEVVIFDGETASAMRRGKLLEFSAGYDVEIEPAPGRTANGEAYDAVQRDIRANHVALLPPGGARCGPTCAVL